MTAARALPATPDAAAVAEPSQVWVGAVNDPSGYTDELRGFLRALERWGYAPALNEYDWTLKVNAGIPLHEREMFDRQRRRTPSLPAVVVHQGLPSWWQRFTLGVPNVQRCMFETDSIPSAWVGPLRDRDEVWVPSAFNRETFARGGVPEERLKILGGTLDFELFDPEQVAPRKLGAPPGHFTFLTNFDFSERKGWRHLLRAWARAFDPRDPVCLVLKTGSLTLDEDDVRGRIEAFVQSELGGRLAPIRVLCDALSSAEMPGLYAGADAYVLASRGEGWGRPYMEALAMGRPTIASNWSGNLAFMEPETSWLVDGRVVPVERHDLNADLYAGHGWFEPDLDELAAALRDVAGDPAAARAKATPARDSLIARFGPEATVARIAELAREASERHGARRARPLRALVLEPARSPVADALHEAGHNLHRRIVAPTKFEIDVPGILTGDLPEPNQLTNGPTIVELTDPEPAPTEDWTAAVHRNVDRVWVRGEGARRRLVEFGVAPGIVEIVTSAAAAEESLDTLQSEGLRAARMLRPARIEARSRFAVYAPDWSDEGAWMPALQAWLAVFGPDDDVTLALYAQGDTDAVGAAVMAHLDGRDEATLPDLALVVPSTVTLAALAASADAVVVDGSPDATARPELLRRARRIVTSGDPTALAALRAELAGTGV